MTSSLICRHNALMSSLCPDWSMVYTPVGLGCSFLLSSLRLEKKEVILEVKDPERPT